MNGSRPRAGRRLTVGLAALVIAMAGCSPDDNADGSRPEPSETSGPQTRDPSVDPETVSQTDSPGEAVAQIEAVFKDYWDAIVRAQSGQSAAPAELFTGLAIDEIIEHHVDVATRYAEQGLVRIGAPVITDVEVTVDGDSGLVSACVDESAWLAEVDGATIPPQPDQLKPHPAVYEVTKSGDSWLIGAPIEPEGTITC